MSKSKKLISVIAIVLLLTMVFTACGKAASTSNIKLGFGAVTSIAGATDATAEKDGNAQTDVICASVAIDSATGKIVNVWIDSIQSNVAYTVAGKIKSDKTAAVQTKRELGDKYGMKAASKLGKEWYQQADELEKFLIGKTKADIAAIKLDATGHATDLAATVSISVKDYLGAVVKAIDAAQ